MRITASLAMLLAIVVGCQKSVDHEMNSSLAASPTTSIAAGAPTIQFKVPDMMCEESCAKAVHDTLAGQPGVVDVQVDFPNRLATVAVDESIFDSQAALAALLDKQFSQARLVDVAKSDQGSEN